MKEIIPIMFLGLIVMGCNPKNENKPEQPNQQELAVEKKQAFSIDGKEVQVYTTADGTDLRLASTGKKVFEKATQPLETEVAIFVNPNKTFQTFLGIGGAITDASAEVFALLSEDKQQEFLKAYYDLDEGIGYSLARTTIHSCDFSKESYTYVSDDDKELKTFSIDPDKAYRIPLIKKAHQSCWREIAFIRQSLESSAIYERQ